MNIKCSSYLENVLIIFVYSSIKLLVEAEDIQIPRMDIGGKADPYVLFMISTSKEEYRTKIVKQNYHPIWNEDFHILFKPEEKPILHMELFDWDHFSKDDLISTRDFELYQYPTGVVIDKWFDFIKNPSRRVKKPGKVHLIIHIANYQDVPFKEKPPEKTVTTAEKSVNDNNNTSEEEEKIYISPDTEEEEEKIYLPPDTEEEEDDDGIKCISRLISDTTDCFLCPFNLRYYDLLISIRGKDHPIAVIMKPVISNLSSNGIFIFYRLKRPYYERAVIYFFIGPNYHGNFIQCAEELLKHLSEVSEAEKIVRINDMKSPEFNEMIQQIHGNQKLMMKDENYGDELYFETKFLR